jgi:signal transduction histidine kinase
VINIPPDVNYFNIEVAGINYINSQWTKYKYRIKEFGQDWIELGTRHEIGFQSLKPGEYHLEVTASDHGKDWNEDIFKLKIIVQAYFWQTRWFWMIFSLIMIISASLIVRSRFKNIKSQKQRVEALVNIRTKELQTANLELKKANETKDHFFTIISHDLKNPIGAAKSISHELKENFKDYNADDQQEFLNILYKSINSLANLLKDLLTWSRMQQEDIVPHPEEVILLKCVNRTLEVLSQNIQKKELEIKIDISEDLLLWVDKNILSTIIRNLLSNAIKFTPNGGQISISTLHSSQEIIIQFKDNGIGIPDDVLKKLFIPGGVMSHPGTNNEKGTGMGLVLLKEFVDLCNGEIWVESTVGKGSVFFVSLPAYLALSTAK